MTARHRRYPVTRADLARYATASGDGNPIHLDADAAVHAGLPDVVAHGMLTMGLALRLVTEWAGDPGAVRDCRAQFLRAVPVPAEDGTCLDVRGEAAAVDGDGAVTVRIVVSCGDEQVARVTATVSGDHVLQPELG
jgi:acyl dehydratase